MVFSNLFFCFLKTKNKNNKKNLAKLNTANNRTKIRKLGGIEISMKVLSSSKSNDLIADMTLDLIHSLSWEGTKMH
jgi:hypothetical protein